MASCSQRLLRAHPRGSLSRGENVGSCECGRGTHHGMIFNQDHLGLSENSVPNDPMVNDHYPY